MMRLKNVASSEKMPIYCSYARRVRTLLKLSIVLQTVSLTKSIPSPALTPVSATVIIDELEVVLRLLLSPLPLFTLAIASLCAKNVSGEVHPIVDNNDSDNSELGVSVEDVAALLLLVVALLIEVACLIDRLVCGAIDEDAVASVACDVLCDDSAVEIGIRACC